MTGGSDGIRDIGLLESALRNTFSILWWGRTISKYTGKGSETLLWTG